MTDNRTTELREKLTERGIEWTGSRYSGVRHAEHTKWTTASGYHAKFTEYDDGQTALIVEAQSITPEQAIAATLGSDTKPCYATDYTHEHCKYSVNRGWVENVELGSGTCEFVIEDNMNESEGMGDVWFRCTNCCTCYDYYADDWLLKMPHCPKCGAIVEGVR